MIHKSILFALLAGLSGCAIGYNSTLFVTQSNVGLDAETKPPQAEISISRSEGVIAPGFEGGQTPPVVASFRNNSNPLSRFLFGVRSTFAGGDAASGLSREAGDPDRPTSQLCLSTQPNSRQFLFWDMSVSKKDDVEPFVFATDTIFGLKVGWSGTAGPFPDSVRLGFNRKEAAWAPVFGTDVVHCTIPATAQPGTYAVWMPSFLAVLDNNVQAGKPSETGVKWLQYFATGASATNLANQDAVRSVMLAQTLSALDVGQVDSDEKSVSCILDWMQTPANAQTLQTWWAGQGLPGLGTLGIIQSKYSTQRKTFMSQQKITCK
jgi:hypothetical protein